VHGTFFSDPLIDLAAPAIALLSGEILGTIIPLISPHANHLLASAGRSNAHGPRQPVSRVCTGIHCGHLGHLSTIPLAPVPVALACAPALDDLNTLVHRWMKEKAVDASLRAAAHRRASEGDAVFNAVRSIRSSERHHMSYATLMVHMELGRPNTGLLNIAAELAERFHAGVIGIAARQPLQMVYGEGYVSGDLYQQDRDEIVKELNAAEAEFHAALGGRVAFLEWRSAQMYAYLANYLANEARCADLVLTGVGTGDFLDSSRAVNTGELIMQTGRPVLIVPTTASTLKLDRVLVGWKDTPESRRAVSDALALLKQAAEVSVVEIATRENLAAAGAHVNDVVAWLQRHDVKAQGSTLLSSGDDATALYAIGQDKGIDIVVAGAYGHSRLREWILGGVTRDLLLSANHCSLVSH
jgi:nucleotide-binding universal stress UspA family protein